MIKFDELLAGKVGKPVATQIETLGDEVELHQIGGDELIRLIVESTTLADETALDHMAYWAVRFTKGSTPTDEEVSHFKKNGAPIIKEIYQKGSQLQSSSKAELEKTN